MLVCYQECNICPCDNYALVAERSGSGRKYDSSAEGSSGVAKTIEECCKRDLRENSAL